MNRWIVRHPLAATFAPLAVFVASAGLLLAWQSARRHAEVFAGQDRLVAEGPDDFGAVGPFAFTERSGHTVSQETLRGKVWIVGCFFTCCTESCPKLSGSLARLQAELAGEPDVRLVSVTVDPTTDTPETLGRYATAYNADADRWLFLTGTEDTVRQFVRERLKLAAEKNTAKDATPGNRVLHDPRLTLIDKRGHINGYFDGTDPEAVGRLKAAAERLAREAP
jgi:protein SCO1/2